MAHYSVYSSEWDEIDRILDDGTGPSYPVSAYAEVEASTAREAKVLAVREWRRAKSGPRRTYIRDCKSDNRSPFAGLKVWRWCEDCWQNEDKVCPKHDAERPKEAKDVPVT